MNKIITGALVTLLVWTALLAGCGEKTILIKATRDGHLDRLLVKSEALADNTIGDSGERVVYVFLPPGYEDSGDFYPVLYYFHGQGGDSTELLRFEESLYNAMDKKQVPPYILVGVNGDNPLGGTFYVNSVNSGRWQDHLTDELIPLIDKRYRTLAVPESRGLMGFSMGGFGVLHNGLTRPDLFGAVWALCPGVLEPEIGLPEAMTSWKGTGGTFLTCYAAAFSKTKAQPLMDGSDADKAVRTEWENGFGNWDPRLAAWYNTRGAGESNLTAVRIVAGTQDPFTWITKGSCWLAGVMKEGGLPVEYAEYTMGHTVRAGTIKDDAFEFFGRNLKR
jgi:enterochelin esterase-like enzyme